MDSKWKVLAGIVVAVFFLGAETVGRWMGFTTYYAGYILGAISFLMAMILGTRRN